MRLLASLAFLPIMLALAIVPQPASADDSSSYAAYDPEGACREIKTALNALAVAEHRQGFALDLASEGASSAIVAARLSDLLDRTQDLRAVLKHARESPFARDAMVDQCTRMGFRALVISEKLTSDVESVLFGKENDDSMMAANPELKSNDPAPPPPQIR